MSVLFRPAKQSLKFVRSFSASAARSDLNKIQLIGRVGADPTKTEVGERHVTNYTVATSETRPDKEGNLIKRTQWHRITYWQSGDWFKGILRYSDYVDKDNNPRTRAEIHQTAFKLLNPSRNQTQEEDDE
ncbi:hypothetical protein [Parasitella parasitica]|uniref:Single-stranded DNA-binding protein n=1 Tax=Parasitella parasitica TaxID=35722 RepID=A0A0B7MZ90_9FUNG|nr:hypothetical protein [Parasitella parasitica]